MENGATPNSGAPLWRRDGANGTKPTVNSSLQGTVVLAQVSTGASHQKTVSPWKARRGKRTTSVNLAPITPLHAIVPGSLDINQEHTRVVYLAPITSTAAEKYFSRTKANPHSKSTPSDDDEEDAEDSDGNDESKPNEMKAISDKTSHVRSPINRTLQLLLAKQDRRMALCANRSKSTTVNTSVFAQIASYDETTLARRRAASDVAAKPHSDRQDDDQLERLRLQVHSMPVTVDDQQAFLLTVKNYQRLQMEYRASMRHNGTSIVGFNVQASWNRELLKQRHQLWVQTHDERLEENRGRKAEEDGKYEQRILESTTEHRTQMRELRDVRLRLQLEAQMLLPTLMLSAATQIWLSHLRRHWQQQQLQTRLRGIIRFWCKERSSRNLHVHAVHLLINWLQKSVAVKSVSFRVFRGIRNYVRRVKKLQRLWKIKQAKRIRNFLLLKKMWVEDETALVDQANEEFDEKHMKVVEKRVAVASKKKKPKATASKNIDQWLTFVSVEIRHSVMKAFIREKEVGYKRVFRQQEEDLLPHLVQTLRGENPNRARSYVKAMANGSALLGRVYTTLCQFPGAVDGVAPVMSFNIHDAPIHQLILQARECSPPDTTGARYGVV